MHCVKRYWITKIKLANKKLNNLYTVAGFGLDFQRQDNHRKILSSSKGSIKLVVTIHNYLFWVMLFLKRAWVHIFIFCYAFNFQRIVLVRPILSISFLVLKCWSDKITDAGPWNINCWYNHNFQCYKRKAWLTNLKMILFFWVNRINRFVSIKKVFIRNILNSWN